MAETIHVRGEGGQVITMDLPLPEDIAARLETGHLRRVNADGSPYTESAAAPEPARGSALTQGLVPRPGKNAPKSDWVAWAVAVHGLDPGGAEAMTKADLTALPDHPEDRDTAAAGGSDLTAGRSPRPAEDAPKAEWIAHVVSRGLLSAEDAANYTRDDLIEMAD